MGVETASIVQRVRAFLSPPGPREKFLLLISLGH